jgi:hypothetical protein
MVQVIHVLIAMVHRETSCATNAPLFLLSLQYLVCQRTWLPAPPRTDDSTQHHTARLQARSPSLPKLHRTPPGSIPLSLPIAPTSLSLPSLIPAAARQTGGDGPVGDGGAALLPAQVPRLALNLSPNFVQFPAAALAAMSLSAAVTTTAAVGFWALTVEFNSWRCGRSRSRTSQIDDTRSQAADGGRARCGSRTCSRPAVESAVLVFPVELLGAATGELAQAPSRRSKCQGFDCFLLFFRVLVAKLRNFGIFVFRSCNNTTL